MQQQQQKKEELLGLLPPTRLAVCGHVGVHPASTHLPPSHKQPLARASRNFKAELTKISDV